MFSFQDCCFALFLNLSALYPQALALLINFRVILRIWGTKFVNVRYKVLCLAKLQRMTGPMFFKSPSQQNLLTE